MLAIFNQYSEKITLVRLIERSRDYQYPKGDPAIVFPTSFL